MKLAPAAASVLLALAAAPAAAGRELVVALDDAVVRSRCADSSATLAKLAKGQLVRLRFALAGADNRCFAISAEIDGRTLKGYVRKEALAGLDQIDRERRQASASQIARGALESLSVEPRAAERKRPLRTTASSLGAAAAALNAGDPRNVERILAENEIAPQGRAAALLRAKAYLRMTRPRDALAVLEPALVEAPDDPALLGLAGMAALQRDQRLEAIRYLKRSVEIAPNPSLEKLYRKIEHERRVDKSDDTTYGMRFTLRYEGDALAPEKARRLTGMLDREVSRISAQLGCRLNERLAVVVQTRENYRSTTGAADWSGGRYDGRIHIALPPSGDVDAYIREAFAHEFVHACLSRMGRWPGWVQEGLAQHLSGRRLSAEARIVLAALNNKGDLPSLKSLGSRWAKFSAEQAAVAYALSLAAAQVLYQDLQLYGVRNLLNDPSRLPEISARLDRRLKDSLR